MINDILFILIATIVSAILGYILGRRTSGSSSSSYNDSSNQDTSNLDSENRRLQQRIADLEASLRNCEQENRQALAKVTSAEAKAASITSNQPNQVNVAQQNAANKDMASLENEKRRLEQQLSALESDLRNCRQENSEVQAKLATAEANAASMSSTSTGIANKQASPQAASSNMNNKEAELNFAADKAKAAFGKSIKADDLKIVEGIGPKISSILQDHGIKTWYQLSQTAPERISEILITVGGDSYKIHDPGTWPKQAGMAHNGNWQELASYQDRLKGGKEV